MASISVNTFNVNVEILKEFCEMNSVSINIVKKENYSEVVLTKENQTIQQLTSLYSSQYLPLVK